MAQNIQINLVVDDKGTIKEVSQQAKAAKKGLEATATSAHSADRRLKGAAQASSNTSKNFSKMAQGITGGLVPAYAVLAANVFAISAAFNFFREAADFSNSIGLELHFGHGITFDSVGELSKIKEVKEFNIGHFIISESVFLGLEKSISKFRELIKKGRNIQ